MSSGPALQCWRLSMGSEEAQLCDMGHWLASGASAFSHKARCSGGKHITANETTGCQRLRPVGHARARKSQGSAAVSGEKAEGTASTGVVPQT